MRTMDWELTIEKNRASLLQWVGIMFDMLAHSAAQKTLPRAVYFSILRLLRPLESATRRLIVLGMRNTKPPHTIRQQPLPDFAALQRSTANHVPAFKLYDPRKRFDGEHHQPTPQNMPRISVPGICDPKLTAKQVAAADTLPFAPLQKRMAALKAALDDLPKQAKRLARAQAKRATAQPGPKRVPPLRPGAPPGFNRCSKHEPQKLLAECHNLARDALEGLP